MSPIDNAFDIAHIKSQFPLLSRLERGHRIAYLDSAATSQKPRSVLDAMTRYYEHSNANVHRGAYELATEATEALERGRRLVAGFIGAPRTEEVIFTRNATEAINLVAHTWGRANLNRGDAVVLSMLEHHANIVPWHMLAAERGIELRWIPVSPDGRLDLTGLDNLLDGAKLLSVSAASNVFGTLTPLRAMADRAHAAGAVVLADACQYVPHVPTDVSELGVDFLAFSAHKMCGPTGIGALWGKAELLDAMPPFMGGGEMILDVRVDGFTTNEIPWKFEAGTPAIAEAVGFGAAVEFLTAVGMTNVRDHERALTAYALRRLRETHGDDLTVFGPPEPSERCGLATFTYKDVHAHDLAQVLDESGVCVRAGHHCAKPLMRMLGVPAAARASWYLYNDEADIDALVDGLAAADAFGF